MKIYFFIISLFLAQFANAKDLRHFNADVLGQSVNNSINLLASATTNAIEPKWIQVDVKDGKYSAATIIYPRDLITMEEARASLNSVYKKYERLFSSPESNRRMGLWRNTDKKFAIQLTDEKDDEGIRVAYIAFIPMNELLEHVAKAGKIIEKEQAKKKRPLGSPKYSK